MSATGFTHSSYGVPTLPHDIDPIQFAQNLEFTEAEFFLHAVHGVGLDQFMPCLMLGGPPPVGAMKANLDKVTWRIITEFGYEEVGHLRAIQNTVGGFPRPLIDLSAHNFARDMDEAFGYHLDPPFDPYINSLNFLLASYVIPYLGINGYTGTNPIIDGYARKKLLAGLLGVGAGQARTPSSDPCSSSGCARRCLRTRTSRWPSSPTASRRCGTGWGSAG